MSKIPENWDDEEVEVETPVVETKRKPKLSIKYSEIEQHLPKLFKVLRKEKLEYQRKFILQEHLEAVSFWRPKRALVTETRHESNKKKDEEDYTVLIQYWKVMLQNINLAEKSTTVEREKVKQILEKYAKCEARTFTFEKRTKNLI